MQPTRGDVHVNKPLTNIMTAYLQNTAGFVSTRVFPNVPVSKQSDSYFTVERGAWNRDEMRKRAPGAQSVGGGFTLGNDNYFAHVWAFHQDIPDQIRGNVDAPINLDAMSTKYVSGKGLLRREREWASKFFVPGVWGTDITGVAASPGGGEVLKWSDASSDPIGDIKTRATAMQLATGGMRPNVLVMARTVWDKLSEHPDLIDRVKYGQTAGRPASVTREAFAALVEIDRIEVMDGVYNAAVEGAAEANAFIGGNHALLAYAAPEPGIMTISAGYTFSWNGYLGADANGGRISRLRADLEKVDRIEIEMAFDMKVVAADLGNLFASII